MNAANRDRFDDLPILAELRERLEARFTQVEHRPRAALRSRLKAWSSSSLAAVPAVMAAVTAVAVAVVALAVLRPGHSGQRAPSKPAHQANPAAPLGPANPTPAQLSYINEAQHATIARDPACAARINQGATLIHGRPSRALLSTLGVLRRPAPPADETNHTLYQNGFNAGAGVYVDYIRRARTEFHKSFYIIPEARTTPFSPIPSRCYGEMRAALVHEIRHLSRAQQAQIIQLQAEQLSAQRAQTEHREGVCFAVVSTGHVPRFHGVDMGCSQGIPTLQRGMSGWIGEDHPKGGVLLAGIVPDGVATVTLNYAAGNGHPARTITSTVINNVAAFEVPAGTFHQDSPASVAWRAADGRVLMTSTSGS